MKRSIIVLLSALIALLSGCYDDSGILEQISDINGRLEKLEQLCNQLNTNVDALQSIVDALQKNDYVTSVEPVIEGKEIIGYEITFSKSGSITIYHGKDGSSGADGHTPKVSVSKDEDGNYYWTVDGEWVLDSEGQKIRANGIQGEDGAPGQDGVTPEFKIEDGYWFVSYDNGSSWEQLGKASGEDGDSMFSEIRDGDDSVTFVLADGTELVVPKKSGQGSGEDVSEIKSITYVPEYSDGKAAITWYYDNAMKIVPEDFHIDLNILPSGSASEIASAWQSTLSAEAVYTLTKSLVDAVSLEVKAVESDGDYLRVTLSGANLKDDFYLGNCSANVSIKIADGIGEARTEYIPLRTIYLPPAIVLERDDLLCDYRGCDFSLSYSIENPKEGVSLQASCTESWISDINVGTDNVSFTVLPNNTLTSRNAEIIVEYASDTKMIAISQFADIGDISQYEDLSTSGTANCYIVSESGEYKFPAVKGNGNESVGAASSAVILWETFGTDTAPKKGNLISAVSYKDGMIFFRTNSNFREGNAVIAAKDASGKILWSWHIWLTDQPEDQVYNNGAGTMMDRNLGATSATPGDVGALGLLYQWGRKDPFLGSSSVWVDNVAASTISWPEPVESTSSTGTIEYTVANPMTFITRNGNSNYDWYYTGDYSTNKTRWQSEKTIYDPCPPGYRIPDGGDNGVWATAFGTSSDFDENAFDIMNRGINFGSSGNGSMVLSDANICWYPAAGSMDGGLGPVGDNGTYWSCSPGGRGAYSLDFIYPGLVMPTGNAFLGAGYSVRCLKE